jgi:acyl-CoA oxidase
MTSFDHVHLPATAVLGSLEMPKDKRIHFFDVIERITTGTLALSMIMIPALKLVTHITGKYSLRRQVGTPGKTQIPIIKFRTQQAPICHALARLACMEPFADEMIKQYKDTSLKPEVRGGFTVILKAVFLHYAQHSMPQLVERCGAQALFKHNQICDADVSWHTKSCFGCQRIRANFDTESRPRSRHFGRRCLSLVYSSRS